MSGKLLRLINRASDRVANREHRDGVRKRRILWCWFASVLNATIVIKYFIQNVQIVIIIAVFSSKGFFIAERTERAERAERAKRR
jgi:lipid-A-disaccharide synthase-like uncharacterized protein